MSKLPVVSGEKAVKCFEKLGYEVVRLRKLLRDAEISIGEFRELL